MNKLAYLMVLVFVGCSCAGKFPKSIKHQMILSDSLRSKRVPIIKLYGEITNESVNSTIEQMEQIQTSKVAKAIILDLDTPGGSVPSGFKLSKAIEESNVPIVCLVDGDADSMGFYILQACTTRTMTRRSVLMAHEPQLSVDFAGRQNEWQSIADMMKTMSNAVAEWCNHRLTTSIEEYHSKTDGSKMWWFNANDAIKYNAVDFISKDLRSLQSMIEAIN